MTPGRRSSTLRALVALAAAAALALPAGTGTAAELYQDADVYASVSPGGVVLGNAVVERRWSPDALVTTALEDKRAGLRLDTLHADFALLLDGVRVASDLMRITAVQVDSLQPAGGLAVTFTLSLAGLATLERTVEAYPGVAGFAARTSVRPLVPLVVSGYTLDEVAAGPSSAPTIHAFRAGADWREPDWAPQVAIGDPHTGDWRATASAGSGASLSAPGEWLSLAQPGGASLFMVMERHDYASSRMSYDGSVGAAVVDLSRDIIYIGPFEESAHVENPTPLPARHRVLLPLADTPLERVFTGFGIDADDEPWQFFSYLAGHRLTPYRKAVTFNTNGVDAGLISTGAKDDVDHARFLSLAAAAREMGVETFIFDDGWQAISGDWCPDSPQCPEPRGKYPPRFLDDHFGAVRGVLRNHNDDPSDDIALGLWMTPMEFNPASTAFETNPQWACIPAGLGTAALNLAQPDDGSNEAGIGVWNPEALGLHPDPDDRSPVRLVDYIEGRIERMIASYGASYFKFDFLVWLDCVGVAPVDMYAYRESFLAIVDRLQAAHPEVTFQIDETNDYRLFPFESAARGPSWFQNGKPPAHELLHNIWSLAPHIPGFSLGQHALGNSAEVDERGVDYLMAVALGSHITFWSEIDDPVAFTPARIAQIKRWTDFYKAARDDLATFTYPLLEDPRVLRWTALQPWNPDTGTGYLLAYNQAATNPTQTIALRGVRGSGSFALTLVDPATGSTTPLGIVTADGLRSGIPVTIAEPYGYAIIGIAPA